LSITFFNFFYK